MADYAGTEYKFPDDPAKNAQVDESAVEVEVVDDTPPEDRGREPINRSADEIAPDDDIAKYGEDVQKRIKQLKKAQHDERRRAEAAERERQAALEYAQGAHAELARTRKALQESSQTVAATTTQAAKDRAATASEKLAAAYEAGDAAEVAKWTREVSRAEAEAARLEAESARVAPREESAGQEPAVRVQSTPQAPPLHPKTREWVSRNASWFNRDPDMTSVAMSVHNRLIANGVDPRSDEYFAEIDKRVRAAFPDEFPSSSTDADSSVAPPDNKPQPKSVAAPVVRASAPRKVVLTESAARIARTLGVPLEEYARQVALLGDKNG